MVVSASFFFGIPTLQHDMLHFIHIFLARGAAQWTILLQLVSYKALLQYNKSGLSILKFKIFVISASHLNLYVLQKWLLLIPMGVYSLSYPTVYHYWIENLKSGLYQKQINSWNTKFFSMGGRSYKYLLLIKWQRFIYHLFYYLLLLW